MKKIVINGGKSISGKVTISGAKNSVVALIPATILANDIVTLEGVPDISDVASLVDIMEIMGAKIQRDTAAGILTIDTREVVSKPLPYGKINSLRASYYFNGALLGRFGKSTVGLPGGCDLGPRPMDLHVKAFEALGAELSYLEDAMHLEAKEEKLHGTTIYMDMVSVGATINTMLAASTAEGVTIIENAAREPEIIDVATLLNNMGAKVRGAGTDVIRITGKPEMHGNDKQLSAEEAAALGYPDGGGIFMMIKQGPQRMDGRTLLNYARFRHDDQGDFGRVQRQQQVMQTLTSKVKNPLTLFTGASAMGTARAVTMTNLPNTFLLTKALPAMFGGIENTTIPSDNDWQSAYDMYGGSGILIDMNKYSAKAQELLGQ